MGWNEYWMEDFSVGWMEYWMEEFGVGWMEYWMEDWRCGMDGILDGGVVVWDG